MEPIVAPDSPFTKEGIIFNAKISFLLFLDVYGPFFVIQHAEAQGITGPLTLIPGLIAFLTGFVPLGYVLNHKLRIREEMHTNHLSR
jgi:hypothetical protein